MTTPRSVRIAELARESLLLPWRALLTALILEQPEKYGCSVTESWGDMRGHTRTFALRGGIRKPEREECVCRR